MHVVRLEAEVFALQAELAEALKLVELQQADLERFEKAIDASRPHCPERTVDEQLQLGWERILVALESEKAPEEPDPTHDALQAMDPPGTPRDQEDTERRHHSHGRRGSIDMESLPTKLIELDPPEVIAVGGEGYRLIGEEVSNRIGYRHGGYVRVKLVRRKWARVDVAAAVVDLSVNLEAAGVTELPLPPVVLAGVPDCMWPRFMADPSAISNVIVTKYGDVIPLHRQETISTRGGFSLARSTLCNWLREAHRVLYRIVDGMLDEAQRSAFCIATDATGAPVKGTAGCASWHVFVLVADRDHVIFRHAEKHNSAVVSSMLAGFDGYVLADASSVYDSLYRDGDMTEAGCWSHQRRYFWKAVETEPGLAYEALSLISQLFAIERDCKDLTANERKIQRVARAGPVLDALDRWVDQQRDEVDPRGRIRAAITYYDYQRGALRQFLEDGRLPIHNNVSERALRNLVLGRSNWLYFANENGLKWYTVFRSLIASCGLHGLNPQIYLEQVLRLAPHWPVTRMLKGAVEGLHLRASHGPLPALGLHVHLLEPEPVEGDDPVDTTVPRAADSLEVGATRSVSHGVQEVEHERLEELRRCCRHRLQQLFHHGVVQLGEGLLQPVVRACREGCAIIAAEVRLEFPPSSPPAGRRRVPR